MLSIVMFFSHHRITGCLRDAVQTSLSISGTIYVPPSTGCLMLVTAVSGCSLCFSSFPVTFLVIPVSVSPGLFSLRRFIYAKPFFWSEAESYSVKPISEYELRELLWQSGLFLATATWVSFPLQKNLLWFYRKEDDDRISHSPCQKRGL